MGGVVNGWKQCGRQQHRQDGHASVTFKPKWRDQRIENYIAAPRTTGTNDNFRNLSDTVVSYTVDRAQRDGKRRLRQDGVNKWWGVAGYLKYRRPISSPSCRASSIRRQGRVQHRAFVQKFEGSDGDARDQAHGGFMCALNIVATSPIRPCSRATLRLEEESAIHLVWLPVFVQHEILVVFPRRAGTATRCYYI